MLGTVIITAGGIGKRMGGNLPKQFLSLHGKPILLHSLEKFHHYDPKLQLIVTLPSDWLGYWQELLQTHQCHIPHEVVVGGEERFHSIQLALDSCKGSFIAVHDGVRPLVSEQTIERCFNALLHAKSVVPVLALKDSLRAVHSDGSKMVNRSEFKLVHTPQCFDAETLKKAYQTSYHSGMTDDASVVEALGIQAFLVDSNEENIKITTNSDLLIADAYMQQMNSK